MAKLMKPAKSLTKFQRLFKKIIMSGKTIGSYIRLLKKKQKKQRRKVKRIKKRQNKVNQTDKMRNHPDKKTIKAPVKH